jgi:G3E family GTPase
MRPVPVTLITGFLGSGKTTLLKRILAQRPDVPIAVIENEFGEVGVDDRLLGGLRNAEIVTLSGGCVCCTARDGFVHALGALHEQRGAGTVDFERVLVETTGLSGIVELVRALARDQKVVAHYRLDAIVTIVDARHGGRQLDDFREAQEQVAVADRILMSKCDLVPDDEASRLRQRIAKLNAHAPIARMHFGDTPIADILDVRRFDVEAALGLAECSSRVGPGHARRIGSFAVRASRPFDPARLDACLAAIIDLYGADMLRYKGVLHLAGRAEQVIVQGVQSLLQVEAGPLWPTHEARQSVLVFIGRDLPIELFRSALDRCLLGPPSSGRDRANACVERERRRALA